VSDARLLTGIGVSPGLAVGQAVVVHFGLPEVPHQVVAEREVAGEVARLDRAIRDVRQSLEDLRRRTAERVGPEEAKIFEAQIMMLEDTEFLDGVRTLILENQLSAARAYEFKALEIRAQFASSNSARLRERVADLSGLHVRVLRHLLGRPVDELLRKGGARPAIILTRELTPGLTIQFDGENVIGLASEEGTRTSHAAILARSLGIPCVMGLVGGTARIASGTEIVLDGGRGTVLIEPTPAEVRAGRAHERRRRALERQLERVVGQPATSLDGITVRLAGNLDLPEELDATAEHGAEGVGLLRTEFLLVGRAEMPTEDEQAKYFTRVAKRFPNQPILVRTFDLGGDKFPAVFRSPPEPNPFLGWRAIRVCLDHPDMFRTQIRAALRARLEGDVRLMLPLVIGLDEVEACRSLVEQSAVELERRHVPAARSIPMGVMVETPAAALLAHELARQVDFLSVGSNDLTQYTVAVDRGNARLAERFSSFHPAVVRQLRLICEAGEQAGKPTGVCGEMASEPLGAYLLIGLGYRSLSVSPPALPLVRWLVRQIDVLHARQAAQAALEAPTAAEVSRILASAMSEHVNLRFLEAGRLPKPRRSATLKTS
jgi:phosphotransferase system enzyme I (PtsI)